MELRIKEICKQKGITQAKLAEMTGITRPAISKLENPTLNTLVAIAEALDVPVSDLFIESIQITGAVRVGDNVRLIDSVQDIEKLLSELKGS